jgi:hypothetical protein
MNSQIQSEQNKIASSDPAEHLRQREKEKLLLFVYNDQQI